MPLANLGWNQPQLNAQIGNIEALERTVRPVSAINLAKIVGYPRPRAFASVKWLMVSRGRVMLLRLVVYVLGFFFASAVACDARADEKLQVEIVPQLGHSAAIFSVAITPDGKTALSGGDDNTLRLWDLATGRVIRRFTGHSRGILPSVAMALSRSWLAGTDLRP